MTKQEIFEREVTKFAKSLYKKLKLNENQNTDETLVSWDELMDACDTVINEWFHGVGDDTAVEVIEELGYDLNDEIEFDEVEPEFTERFHQFAGERLIELFPHIDFPDDCDMWGVFEYLGYPTFFDDHLVDAWQAYIDPLGEYCSY